MCGVVGFIDFHSAHNIDSLKNTVSEMNARLVHRGPDAWGVWCDEKQGVALAHRRLAIIDLSEHGAQPMVSSSGRYVLSYNGEIYNFLSLKVSLSEKGYKFRGTSDTEVFLAAIEEWGIKETLRRINGMFAFALWDKKERTLYLGRDRLGKKPLYYGWAGKAFVFASELKALRAHPSFSAEIDRDALALYLRCSYVPSPRSIYKNIHKLPAASFVVFSLDKGKDDPPVKYWDIKRVAEDACRAPLDIPFEDAANELEHLLDESVRERMVSDVPLGVFLSGGVDSSLVTALMQKNSVSAVQSFCIGFEEAGYNEAEDAAKIAKHLGTDHTEFYVTAEEARNVIPDLPDIYDEPFADPSQIPTYHVSRLARRSVSVALSGDGGDESFAGYNRYQLANNLAKGLSPLPYPVKKCISRLLLNLPLSGRACKFLELVNARDDDDLYRLLMSFWKTPEILLKPGREPLDFMDMPSRCPDIDNFIHRMMCVDTLHYLPDDILVKVDRASMAVSLETRDPLLDYRVIEYAWKLPIAMKMHQGRGKRILRAILERHVPATLFERPKQGFGIPHGQWLRGPLREWAETLLSEKRLEEEGFFNTEPIRKKWQEHVSRKNDWGYLLWSILMFQAWLERQKS